MDKQIGIDVLEYECSVLDALNKCDRNENLVRREMELLPLDVIESIESSINSVICDREERLAKYRAKLEQVYQEHDPKSNSVSKDALEFLYQEFLKKNLHIILNDIEKFYHNNVDYLMKNGIAHFERMAKKAAKHNLYNHAAGSIVLRHLNASKTEDLNQAISLLSSRLSSKFIANKSRINYIIKEKYDYFESRIICCLEIGDKIRSLY